MCIRDSIKAGTKNKDDSIRCDLQHIYTFTTHSLLTRLAKESMLVPCDMDTVVALLTDVALSEMFSNIAEEHKIYVEVSVQVCVQ